MTARATPFVLTALVGLAVGRAWPGAPAGVGPQAEDPAGRGALTLPPCPDADPIVGDVRALTQELGRLDAEILKGQIYDADAIGLPVEWPDDLPDLWREASVEQALLAALGSDGELLALDCSEYPCQAVVAPLARTADSAVAGARSDEVRASLKRAGLDARTWPHVRSGPDGRPLHLEVLTFFGPGPDVPMKRYAFRGEEIVRSVEPAILEVLRHTTGEAP